MKWGSNEINATNITASEVRTVLVPSPTSLCSGADGDVPRPAQSGPGVYYALAALAPVLMGTGVVGWWWKCHAQTHALERELVWGTAPSQGQSGTLP